MKKLMVGLFIFVIITSEVVFIPASISEFGVIGIDIDDVNDEIDNVCGDNKGGIKYWRWIHFNGKLVGIDINIQCINYKK